jgi:hypothetical protein
MTNNYGKTKIWVVVTKQAEVKIVVGWLIDCIIFCVICQLDLMLYFFFVICRHICMLYKGPTI